MNLEVIIFSSQIGLRLGERMRILLNIDNEDIESVANIISGAFKRDQMLFVAGNGGSAADAQHFVGEMVCVFKDKERRGFPAVCLNTNTSVITAWANDKDYNSVFARQLDALGKKGDVFVGITTSGNSQNIINALYKANEMGMYTIIITGDNYSRSHNKYLTCSVVFDSRDTPRIQEHTIAFIHQVCGAIEEKMKKRSIGGSK
jgi:D-sedoheptulose 7-phosphate isomerase